MKRGVIVSISKSGLLINDMSSKFIIVVCVEKSVENKELCIEEVFPVCDNTYS